MNYYSLAIIVYFVGKLYVVQKKKKAKAEEEKSINNSEDVQKLTKSLKAKHKTKGWLASNCLQVIFASSYALYRINEQLLTFAVSPCTLTCV